MRRISFVANSTAALPTARVVIERVSRSRSRLLGTAGGDQSPEPVLTCGRRERRERLVPVLERAVLAAPGEDRAGQGVQLVLEGGADRAEGLVRPSDDDGGGVPD